MPVERDLVGVVLSRAQECPCRVALRDATGEITYQDLAAAVGSIGSALHERGIGAGQLVGVGAGRTVRTPLAMLGVLATGAAYVPIDPTLPAPRRAAVLADAGLSLMIDTSAEDRQPDGIAHVGVDELRAHNSRPLDIAPGELAYVLFTSGSTGRPKGVRVTQAGVLNLLSHMAAEPGLRAGERMLGVTTPAFDLSVPDLFLPLTIGATGIFTAPEVTVDGAALGALIARESPDLMQATPSTWRLLLESGWTGAPKMRVVCGGEGFEAALVRSLCRAVGEVWNFYGPTETTVWSVAQQLAADVVDPVPMGFPIMGTSIAVRRDDGTDAAADEAGELVIGGAGVALGYLGAPELTARAFGRNEQGERTYRTGDIVRRDARGRLTYVGRRDGQVKLRGHRIELGDIETTAASLPGVARAVAVLVPEPDAVLVLFVVGAGGSVRERLVARLPAYMRPSMVIELAAVPLTARNKVDRAQLLEQARAALRDADVAVEFAETPTPIEEVIAAEWVSVLSRPVTGLDADFFALGGDSLRAARVIARLSQHFDLELGVTDLFAEPTVRGLAVLVLERLMAALPPSFETGGVR